jgi:diaminopimelate epimerase
MQITFTKYHAIGNDYIVIDPAVLPEPPSLDLIRRICHRNYGPGSDGILYGPLPIEGADFGLRIFNPDGSEAEKSGNGLRIFCRYLWDCGRLAKTPDEQSSQPFTVHTAGGMVQAVILENGAQARIAMGRANFDSAAIPVAGPRREVVSETMQIDGEQLSYCAVTVGNPHCIVLRAADEALARRLGAQIETEARFPNRTNVQFLDVIDRSQIRIQIWERGAGYTLASGSSSCAAAATAYRLGQCDGRITVHNPGGDILVELTPDFALTMTGPIEKVYEGRIEIREC